MSNFQRVTRDASFGLIYCLAFLSSAASAADAPDFATQIAPIFTKYCAGCHNSEAPEGELALDTMAGLMKGGDTGAVITPGNSNSSRLIGVLTGRVEPPMPPEDEEAPTEEEIALLAAWIDAGAQGPVGPSANRPRLITPKIEPVDAPAPVTSIAISPDEATLAISRFSQVELRPIDDVESPGVILEHPGKVQSVRYSADGKYLVTATGITGLYGEARLWNGTDGSLVKTFPDGESEGHRDIVYAAVISPDGSLLATAGYDRNILLWDMETGELIRTFTGHNGAVFDLAFSADGNLLASASADATIKVWHVASGRRLDTRSEPLKEQNTTAISPDGQLLVGGGEDSRIRVWRLVATDELEINPLILTRFAHEGAIHLLRFSENGEYLISSGMDGEVKLWETDQFSQVHSWPNQPASVQAVSISSTANKIAVGRMDGSIELYPLVEDSPKDALAASDQKQKSVSVPTGLVSQIVESEPNDSVAGAMAAAAPTKIKGVVFSSPKQESSDSHAADVDYFRFTSLANQTWIIEVRAERDESPLDSHVEVLDANGNPIPRVKLQATYDSYFAFRGKDSVQDQDFRLHNWREMRLNQYLYCNGEVVKFYQYPRGPDSGFNVYSNGGKRCGYFGTTPITHALNEPCYIVEPYPPGAEIVPNGLPTFTVNYENDDDSIRRFGSDSFLTFTAPYDGDYVVRLSDVRGLEGEDYHYELAIRAPQPDFAVKSIQQDNTEVTAGTGHRFSVVLDRIDGFDGPVTIHIDGLPPGFSTHSPLVIPAGHLEAWGALYAAADVVAPSEDGTNSIKLTAEAEIDGRVVRKWPVDYGKIELKQERQLEVALAPNEPDPPTKNGLPVLEIMPGTTTTFVIRVERSGYEGRVSFGKEDAAHNAPHGVYIDNIGLNGLQIQADETERVAFITAEPWVQPQERVIFVDADEAGKPTSNPVLLRVLSTQPTLTRR